MQAAACRKAEVEMGCLETTRAVMLQTTSLSLSQGKFERNLPGSQLSRWAFPRRELRRTKKPPQSGICALIPPVKSSTSFIEIRPTRILWIWRGMPNHLSDSSNFVSFTRDIGIYVLKYSFHSPCLILQVFCRTSTLRLLHKTDRHGRGLRSSRPVFPTEVSHRQRNNCELRNYQKPFREVENDLEKVCCNRQ